MTTAEDLEILRLQLGREPRGVARIAAHCGCGKPCVVMTEPRLPDGTPFPTVYYLTCPKAASAIGTLEAKLADASLFARDPKAFDSAATRLTAARIRIPLIIPTMMAAAVFSLR